MSDPRVTDDMPAHIKAEWEAHRQKLRELPQVFGATPGGTPPIDPWKVQPITAPDGTN